MVKGVEGLGVSQVGLIETPDSQHRHEEPRGQAPPQYSSDGRWWWDGWQWVPVAPPVAPPVARPRRAGAALARWSLGVGLFTLCYATPMWFIGIADLATGGAELGWPDVLFAAVLTSPGVVLGLLAFRRGHPLTGDLRASAWAGILCSMLALALLAAGILTA